MFRLTGIVGLARVGDDWLSIIRVPDMENSFYSSLLEAFLGSSPASSWPLKISR